MPKRVELPDGKVAEFPDGMSNEEIKRVLSKEQSRQIETPGTQAPNAAESAGRAAVGTAEAGATLLSGAPAQIASGLTGLGSLAYESITGGEDALAETVGRMESVADALTYQPRTKEGQRILQDVAQPFQQVQEVAQGAGQTTLDVTGSPAMATVVQTGAEAAPMALGGGPKGSFTQRRRDVERVEGEAREVGFDVEAPGTRQRQEITESAKRETGGKTSREEGMEDIRQGVINAREQARQHRNELYTEARQTRAGVPVKKAREFRQVVQDTLKEQGFDLSRRGMNDMPKLRNRLEELEEMANLPDSSILKLNALEDWRKGIGRNRPPVTDEAQNAALNAVKAQYDRYIDDLFNSDMIKGDPSSVAKWKKARNAHQRYREQFKDNKVIKDLADKEATPEEVRNWIFGASQSGLKKESARTVGRLKEIVGEDSPQFTALRQNALIDIVDPLLREEPNFKQFVERYDKLVKDNKSVVKELFPESVSHLRKLRDFAKATEKRAPDVDLPNINRSIAQAVFGHGIAKGALKVNLAQSALSLMRRGGDKGSRQKIMSEILGYDPDASLLPKSPVFIGGAAGASREQKENDNQ